MTVTGVAGQSLGVQNELTARGAGVGGDDRDLDAELVRCAGLALANALGLGGMEVIDNRLHRRSRTARLTKKSVSLLPWFHAAARLSYSSLVPQLWIHGDAIGEAYW